MRRKRQLLDRFRDPEEREAPPEKLIERAGAGPGADLLRRVADQLDPPSSLGTAG